MGDPTVNGEKSSKTLDHITSYPVVSDGISTFKNNAYGRKSIDLSTNGYKKFVKPITPYLSGPYSFVAPYVAKADSLGDAGLSKFDNKVPIVKEETKNIQNTLFSYAHFPLVKAGEGKDYLLNKYGEEYQKCGGSGYFAGTKALISTGLLVGSDALEYAASWFGVKKEQTKELAREKTRG
ncbi:MAG: hypothetical protein Q9160_004091 [Pyrenula sp. 1 TL-2023]